LGPLFVGKLWFGVVFSPNRESWRLRDIQLALEVKRRDHDLSRCFAFAAFFKAGYGARYVDKQTGPACSACMYVCVSGFVISLSCWRRLGFCKA
jgi:hypothetical protein